MRVIVVGSLAWRAASWPSRLDREGHEVAVIDKNAGAFRKRLPEGWGGEMVVGFGFDQDDLQAGRTRLG